MTDTVKEFVNKILECELLEKEQIQQHCQGLSSDDQPSDATSLARSLMEEGLITRFQARCILQNRHHRLLLGNYHLIEQIGRGGMGEVFMARHRRMKRIVAIKILTEKVTRSEVRLRRFQREVEAAARLVHPNIVTAFDADKDGGLFYLVMEFVDGQDLGQLIKQQGALDVATAVDYTIQAARGLAYAHEEGVVHRDIKPHNLLVDKQGVVKVLDMGLVSFDTDQRTTESSESLTENNQIIGTLDYMSPEQAEDVHRVDSRTDIYSLGCTLFRILTDKPPFEGKNAIQKLMAHRTHPIPSLRRCRGGIPELLDRVCQKMLAKKAEDRYQSMEEVIESLEACSLALISVTASPNTVSASGGNDLLTDQSMASASTLDIQASGRTLSEVALVDTPSGTSRAVQIASGRPSNSQRQRQRRRSSPILIAISGLSILLLLGMAWFLSRPTLLLIEWPIADRARATLKVDGQKIDFGNSMPLEFRVVPGRHSVVIQRFGFYRFEDDVLVAKRSRVSVTPTWTVFDVPTIESPFGRQDE